MNSVSIEQITYSDKSKSWNLIFWSHEGEMFKKLKITSKQYKELEKSGFRKSSISKDALSK